MINTSNNSLFNSEKSLPTDKEIDDRCIRFKETSATNTSFWFTDIAKPLNFKKLNCDLSVDVAIIGGDIAGLTTAYLLSNAGKKVAVAEDGYIGSGETGHTTAHITHALDDRYFNLEKMFGIDGAILAAESHGKAIDFIESVIDKEKIDCDFERLDGYLFLDPSDNIESLRKEYEATHRVGLPTELVQRAPLHSFDTGQCLRFPNQAQFHPLKYLKGLSQAIANKGRHIY